MSWYPICLALFYATLCLVERARANIVKWKLGLVRCAALQFKAKRPFYFVARYKGMTKMMMSHQFFGFGHKKGEHNGAGAMVKQTLTCEQLLANIIKLQCTVDAMNFLKEKCSHEATSTFKLAKK